MASPVFLTAELRWFAPGQIPEALWNRALTAGGDAAAVESRTDRYLRFDQAAAAGFKLREDRLEAKSLVRSLGRWRLAAGRASGIAEVWEKRSLSVNVLQVGEADDWVDVEKSRLLWAAAESCQAEVARVTLEGKEHWTIGFEAHGKHAEATLRKAAEMVLNDLLPKAPGLLEAPWSLSYPAWLQKTL